VLIEYARARGIGLTVYAPPIGTSNKRATTLVAWSASIASWQPVPNFGHIALDAERYLDSPIGVIQYDVGAPSKAYTPRQVITWVANTEGVSHFNFNDKKNPIHRRLMASFKKDGVMIADSELRKVLHQIGVWTLYAIDHVVPSEPPLIFGKSIDGA
jgi:hypothetical protein